MRALAAVALLAAVVVLGCGGGGGAQSPVPPSSSEPVPELVPGAAARFLVRRAFVPEEPLASYGLDPPAQVVPVAVPGAPDVVLQIGAPVFDGSAYYVRREGDRRVWVVLTESITPLLQDQAPR